LAVNCYVEPVYTLDAGIVGIAASLPELTAHLEAQGFKTEVHNHSVNALAPGPAPWRRQTQAWLVDIRPTKSSRRP
jgi:hypothetical protein